MKYLYLIYKICVAFPIMIILTIITSFTTSIGCMIGNGHFWGYYPGKLWGMAMIKVLLIPVKVTGRENLKEGESYVFVSNHQGSFDIFLIFGHLGRKFKWMMKQQLRKMPLVGIACEKSHQIFVDKSSPAKVKRTYDKARHTLRGGMSLVVFPEGARTYTGTMGPFKRGAYMLADELGLPVVPMTINGSFSVMPRTRKWYALERHPLTLTIHKPIYPETRGPENIKRLMELSREEIEKDLAVH